MEKIIQYIANLIWDIPLIVAIIATGLYFTIASGFFQLRFLPAVCTQTIKSFFKKNVSNQQEDALQPNEIFLVSLGTTVGIGNVTGVALAVMIGGNGAIFWMWISAIVGMIIKTAEVTLATYYRNQDIDGNYYGSPMDYMEKGIGKNMNFKSWMAPASIFGTGIMATFFITLQNYEVAEAVYRAIHIDPRVTSIVYMLVTYLCIYKGIKGYRRIAYRLVPVVLFLYLMVGMIVILRNVEMLVPCIQNIFQEAFNMHALCGGVAGRGIIGVIGQGMSIALFTNEAGWGTAAMLYSRANTKHPVRLGLLSVLEVFIVSMIICTTTALVVGVAGQQVPGISVNDLLLNSFSTGIGGVAVVFIPLILFFFGISTDIGWFLYYEVIIRYFSRKANKKSAIFLKNFKLVYPVPGMLMVFYSTYFEIPENLLWSLMAISTGIPTFINIFSILILSNKFFELIQDYKNKYFNHGKGDVEEFPLFYDQEQAFYGSTENETCENSHNSLEFK